MDRDFTPDMNGFLNFLLASNERQESDFDPIAEMSKKMFDSFVKAGFNENMAYDFTKSVVLTLIASVIQSRNNND